MLSLASCYLVLNTVQPPSPSMDASVWSSNGLLYCGNWPHPTTPDEVRQFLGFIGYYRKFVKDFSKITRPLADLMPVSKKTKRCRSKLLTTTRNCRTSSGVVGCGQLVTFSIVVGSCSMPSLETIWPMYFTFSWKNVHFLISTVQQAIWTPYRCIHARTWRLYCIKNKITRSEW
jgi:hypothetical protein